ncbi:Zinc finger BED domain-containing protein RICESLEEPER 2 [Linum perenne]
MKAKLKEVFMVCEGRICLTTDTWTSIKQMNYMCLTAHFIDRDWKLRKKIIGFRQVFSHKGTAIAEAIMACLDEWGIDKVFSVTVDNASSNDTAIQHIKSLFDNRNTSVCDGQFLHVRCVAHIINLVVSDGLGEISTSVRKIREAVRYVKQSPARLQKFYDFVAVDDIESKKSLCLDVFTRWNSTFLMLQAAEKYETAFEMYALSDRQFRIDLISKVGVPDEDDWNDARRIMRFLKCFYDFTLKVSGSSYVTSNLFFPDVVILYRMLKMWEGSCDNQLSSMANKMRRKYEKYWGDIEKMNKLLYIAVVLDPRRKMDFVAFTLSRVYPEENKGILLADLVKKATYDLYDHYVKTSSVTPPTSSFPTIIEENSLRKIDPVKEYKQYKEEVDGVIYKTELDKYLREEPDDTPDPKFNVLDWWKLNSHRYPILSQMARDVLVVPILIVSSESAFSTGGRVLDAFRSSLTPRIVEALICTQDWLRADSRAPSIEEDQLDIDKIDEGKLSNLSNFEGKLSKLLACCCPAEIERGCYNLSSAFVFSYLMEDSMNAKADLFERLKIGYRVAHFCLCVSRNGFRLRSDRTGVFD